MINLDTNAQLYLQIIEDLHKDWQPHSGQLSVGKQLLNKDKNIIFLQCGRKWGKTEFAVYLLWRHALMNPGSTCYYVTPETSHGKKIVWFTNRLQTFGGKRYLKAINNSDLRVIFNNGSYIQIIGSENFAAANGLTPDYVVYDEFKAFHPRFHIEMNPNRLSKKAPLVIIGTPPKVGDRNRDQYMTYAEECKAKIDAYWTRRSSYDNPHIDPSWLDTEKKHLFARGEFDTWFREYEGKIVVGGNSAIFPMFDKDKYVKTHREIYQEIQRDLKRMEWFCVADPGSTTCFAVLLGCINTYNKHIYLLDEIYEKDRRNTTVREIYPRMDTKMMDLYPHSDVDDDWTKVYDEAAAWFSGEVMNQYNVYFEPTQKSMNKKEHGLSLIKDQMIYKLVTISDRCINLVKEIENYATDDKGNIAKKDDHLIDAYRYLNAAAHYSMVEVLEQKKQDNDHDRGMRRFEDDLADFARQEDWAHDIMKGWND